VPRKRGEIKNDSASMARAETVFFIWDTETTSNDKLVDDIISIGGVLCRLDKRRFVPEAEFHTFVQTAKRIDADAFRVHHIAAGQLRGQPKFPEAVELLRQFLVKQLGRRRVIFLAHNGADFDDVIFYANCVRYQVNFEQFLKDVRCHGFADSLKYLRRLFKNCQREQKPKNPTTGLPSFALGTCHRFFVGEGLENAHDALADSQGLLAVLNSDPLQQRSCLRTLMACHRPLSEAVKHVRKACGIKFTRHEIKPAPRVSRLWGSSSAAKRRKIESAFTTQPTTNSSSTSAPATELASPLWGAATAADRELCRNCISFAVRQGHVCA